LALSAPWPRLWPATPAGALIEHSDETFARQINYILEQLNAPPAAEDEEQQSDNEDEDEDEEGEEEEGEEGDEEEVDVFAEAALPSDGPTGEELLAARYLAGVGAAQQEAAQLRATEDEEERRRAAAPPPVDASSTGRRKLHNPDEPLQRPTTPGGSLKPQEAPTEEELNAQAEAELGAPPGTGKEEAAQEEPAHYPDAGAPEFVEKQETFYKRERLPRTPQAKNRELVPLAPASTRSERQRKAPPAGGAEPASGGGAGAPPRSGGAGRKPGGSQPGSKPGTPPFK
jgi:hypothetical protein